MATEDDLRRLLGEADAPASTLDASSIIRRSRRRRLPAQLGAGAIGVLAVAGIGVIAVPTVLAPQASSTYDQSAMTGGAESDTELSEVQAAKRDPYAYLTCGASVPENTGSMYGLEATLAGDVLTITNVSGEQLTGTYGVPAVTVAQDDVIVAHSGRATIMIAYPLDLAPGQSLDQPIAVPSESCVPGDAETGTEPLPAGEYEVVASLDFVPDVPDPDLPALTDLVVSPPIPLRVD